MDRANRLVFLCVWSRHARHADQDAEAQRDGDERSRANSDEHPGDKKGL